VTIVSAGRRSAVDIVAGVKYQVSGRQSSIADGKGPTRYLPFINEPQAPNPIADSPATVPIHWNAAGDAITYVRTKNGVSNI
jgi:hypothetical protein